MNKETGAGELVAAARRTQNTTVRTLGGWALLANGFVQIFIIIGVVVIGGDAPIFLVASEVLSVLLLLGLPFRLFNPKRGVSVKQDCGAWGSGRASPSWCE
jgi:hypothetical protein